MHESKAVLAALHPAYLRRSSTEGCDPVRLQGTAKAVCD